MTITLPAGALLRPLELPARADAGPTALIRAYAAARNASLLETTGRDDDALSAAELLPGLYSTPDRTRRHWYVERDGDVVGCCALDILQDDGGRTAMLTVAVPEASAGLGIGRAVLDHAEAVARDGGVHKILHWAPHQDGPDDPLPVLDSPTGFGSIPLDRSARFLTRNGYHLEQVERASALVWSGATCTRMRALLADARRHSRDYRIVQWTSPTPAEHQDGYVWMKSRMSTDAPDGDLGSPEETWDAARVQRQDERTAQRGWTMFVTAAQHVETGELCAFNELAIGGDASAVTHQWETLVLSGHRGHRLGMLVKAAGLLAWRDAHPLSPRVVTYNAEENRPMLSINEALGFTPIAYEGAWRKDLT